MKRALCVILIISMLLSMLAGCSDGDSAKHDDTTAIDILTIDTTSPDRAGLYQLYWIPLPTGQQHSVEFAGHTFTHDEYEYEGDRSYNYIDGNVTPSLDALGRLDSVDEYAQSSFISADGDLVVPFEHFREPRTYYSAEGYNFFTKSYNEEIYSEIGIPKLLKIDLDTFNQEIIELELIEGEIFASTIKNIVATPDGGFAGFFNNGKTVTMDDGTEYDGYGVVLGRWDKDGKRVATYSIIEMQKSHPIVPTNPSIVVGTTANGYLGKLGGTGFGSEHQYHYAFDINNNLYIAQSDELRIIDSDGKLAEYEQNGRNKNILKFSGMINNNDAVSVLYQWKNPAGGTKYMCADLTLGLEEALASQVELPSTLTGIPQLAPGCDAYQVSAAGVQAHFYNETPVSLLNWVDYDLRYEDMVLVKVIDAGKIFFIMEDPETGEYKLGLFTANNVEGHVAEQLSAGKTQLTLAYVENSRATATKTIETYVSEFNLKSKDYRVRLLAYKPVGNQTAEDMLVMDIISGKVPDMILFDSDMNYRAFDNLGVCRNLYEFMDKDSVYTRDKFIGAVKKPFENAKGELPYLTILSGISTLVMSKDMADGLDGWTMTELAEFIKTLDKDQYFIDVEQSRDKDHAMALLEVLLPNTICHYVDYDSGKSNFGGDLAKLLEICKNTKISQSYNGVEPKNYREQKIAVLALSNLSSVQSFLRHRYAYYSGAEIAYLGFPTNGDCGSVIVPMSSLAITTKSANPDGAWEFIKACLAYQHDEWEYKPNLAAIEAGTLDTIQFNSGLPCVTETVERMCETLSHYFFQFSLSQSPNNPERLAVGVSNGGWHFAADGSYGDSSLINMYLNDVSSTFYSLAEDDAENLLGLLNDITMVRSLDGDLLDIIYEDAQYYFNGTKSLDETVRIIENRVGIKLAE